MLQPNLFEQYNLDKVISFSIYHYENYWQCDSILIINLTGQSIQSINIFIKKAIKQLLVDLHNNLSIILESSDFLTLFRMKVQNNEDINSPSFLFLYPNGRGDYNETCCGGAYQISIDNKAIVFSIQRQLRNNEIHYVLLGKIY